MKASTGVWTVAGWFAVSPVFADSPANGESLDDVVASAEIVDAKQAEKDAGTVRLAQLSIDASEYSRPHDESALPTQFIFGFAAEQDVILARFSRFSASYTLVPRPAAIGSDDLLAAPALGPPVSRMRRYAGLDNPDQPDASHWLASGRAISNVLTLGYAWRDMHLEGSAFSGKMYEEPRHIANEALKLDSRSARLTFNPAPHWSIQVSRGSLGNLDPVVAGGDVRRTTISSTYRHSFDGGDLETTLAWGRNARKSRETTVGYIAETTLRFSGVHALFGRVERVGSDELLRENESLQRHPFKMSRITVGYVQDIRTSQGLSMDAGALLSRYLIPSHMVPAYGNDPTACMLFVRFKLR